MTDPVPPRPDLPAGETEAVPRAPQATWRAVEAIPVFLVSLVVGVVASLVVSGLLQSCGSQTVAFSLAQEGAFGLTVLLWIRYMNKGSFAALGAPRRPFVDIATGIGVGLALVVVAGISLAIVKEITSLVIGHQPSEPTQVDVCVRGRSLFFLAPTVILAAPFGEELFFRGFLFKGLRRRFAFWPAALVSSAFFGAVHFYPLLIPALFVVGLGLALTYERRQSLLASIAAHATFNVIGFLSIFLSRR
jgi:membrane protease YdiL (CAAX protease family)